VAIKTQKTRSILRALGRETGAATVEFAFAMMGLLLFFAIYMIFVEIFIAQERVVFAGFAAARTHAVKGEPAALAAAATIDPEAAVEIKDGTVQITRHLPIPKGIGRFLIQGQGRLSFIYNSPTAREPQLNDDNPFPY
jgi:Flp pilus assembly protein TadG